MALQNVVVATFCAEGGTSELDSNDRMLQKVALFFQVSFRLIISLKFLNILVK